MEGVNPETLTAAALDNQVSSQIFGVLASLEGGQPAVPTAQPAAPTAQPTAPTAQPAAPTAQPVAPAAQPEASQFTTAPTSADTLRNMFADKPVQPVNVQTTEVPPDTPIPEPENMTDKGRNAWIESRNREKALRQCIEQQKKQIEEFTTKQTQFQTEHDELAKALKAKDDELRGANEKLGKLDLSGSVEFRRKFDEPVLQAEANLDAVIHDSISGADTPDQVARIRDYIMGDDVKFRDYIANLSIDTQGALIEKRRTLKELSAQRAQALDNWQATSRGLSDEAARVNAAEQALVRQRNAEAAIKFNTSDMPVNLRPYITTDESFADEVRSANEAFSAFMQTATAEDMAKAAHLGHFVPGMNRALMLALQEARSLQEELYRLRGIRNIPTRTSSPAPSVPRHEPEKPPTAEDLSNKVESGIADALAPLMGTAR